MIGFNDLFIYLILMKLEVNQRFFIIYTNNGDVWFLLKSFRETFDINDEGGDQWNPFVNKIN